MRRGKHRLVFCACGQGLRLTASFTLLIAALAVAFTRSTPWLASSLAASLPLYVVGRRSISKSMLATLPVAVLALILSLLQLSYGRLDPALPAKTLSIYWLTATAFRLLPWSLLGEAVRPGSAFSTPALYLIFIHHFTFILISESRRLLNARRLAISKPYGRWAFRSLAAALVSLFLRSMIRAERFYAAQLLRGLAE